MADFGSFELVNRAFNPLKENGVSSIVKNHRIAQGLVPNANITQGLMNATNANNAGATSFFGKFNLGGLNSNTLAGIGAGISAFQGFASFMQGKKAFKEQKRMNDLLEKQYQIENRRYEERKAEQERANKNIADSASLMDNSKNTIPNIGKETEQENKQNIKDNILPMQRQ